MAASQTIRPEIQGLRAIAVGVVVVFHIWPAILPGGYVGVDVFFVISGYLITDLLIRSAERDGHVKLLNFYARRARRLLPAAVLVLLFTLVGTLIWLPEARWKDTFLHIAASAVYVENWVLAYQSIDYLAADNAATPVQHYWSLSIEEQFYLAWPLILGIAAWASAKFRWSFRFIAGLALFLIFSGSLFASGLIAYRGGVEGYFVTQTRVWELALGGLLAVNGKYFPLRRGATTAQLAGLAAIIASAMFYTTEMRFPGLIALLPTVGTALVIVGGDVRPGRVMLAHPWSQYIGDRSYSIYLWHWPVIVFYTFTRPDMHWAEGLALLGLVLVLSHLSYRWVEQRFRHPSRPVVAGGIDRPRDWPPIGYGLAASTLTMAIAATLFLRIDAGADTSIRQADYPGPAVLASDDVVAPDNVSFKPSLATLKGDIPVNYQMGCHQNQLDPEPVFCEFGDRTSEVTIALIGDSHAANWLPAFIRIADMRGIRLVSITKSACGFAIPPKDTGNGSCEQWQDEVEAALIELSPDMAFFGQAATYAGPREKTASLIHDRWAALQGTGIRIFALQDTPFLGFDPGDCLSKQGAACATERPAAAERADPMVMAARRMPDVRLIDMTDFVCEAQRCPVVVGNIIVWRDEHHLTATYASALAPFLDREIGFSEPIDWEGAVTTAERSTVRVDMLCGDGGHAGLDPFARVYTGNMADGTLTVERGRLGEQGYETWRGKAAQDGALVVVGEYIEGPGGVKSAEFRLAPEGDGFRGEGRRGIRQCEVSVSPG